nr:hypothetical protein [Tanacetum cinerariifolium]GEX01785.1 hypothetical protein [Tanacetum cinerariifolium]
MSTPKFAETHNLVAFLEKPTEYEGFEGIIDFLNANPFNYALTIQALVDKKKVIITETSVRSDLYLKDAEGTECLPTATIFEQLTLMGQVEGMLKHKEIYVTSPHTKKIFANMKRQGKDFSGKPQQKHKSKKSKKRITEVPQLSDSTPDVADKHVTTTSNDPLLSGEDRLKLTELMELCTQLQSRVLALKTTKANQALEIRSLKTKAKGIVMQEPSETPTPTPIDSSQQPSKAKDKGKAKLIEPEKPLKRKDQIRIDEEMLFNNTIKWIESFVPMDTEDAKRQRIEEENESAELKRYFEIILDNDDDVTIKATPLSYKSPTIVDYKIYKEVRKSFFKIIRADGGKLVKDMYINKAFGYIPLIKTKLLIKKLRDLDGEHQV